MTTRKMPAMLGPQKRSFTLSIDGAAVDTEARTCELSFSSEAPVDMWYGTEILSHAPGCMRVGDRQSSLPLLFNHDLNDLLGKVESISIDPDRKGRALVRFGKDARGDWAMGQAADGILINVSFMYRVFKAVEDSETETYTAIDWEPYEISLVTVPADSSVGVGRSASGDTENPVLITSQREAPPPAAEPQTQPASAGFFSPDESRQQAPAAAGNPPERKIEMSQVAQHGAGAAVPEIETRRLGAEEERKRAAEIDAMCRAHQVPEELRAGLIQRGASIEEARGAVLDLQLQRGAKQVSAGNGNSPDLSEKEKARYSMIRAVNAALSGSWKEAGFELEVSNDIGKRMGKQTGGFFMPTDLPFAMRAPLSAGAAATGGVMVATNLLSGAFIELLRNKARVLQLGATVLSGLVGNVDIPRQIGASTAYWVGDADSLTESEPTFDKLSLAYKTIGAKGVIYRTMLAQSTPDAEMLLRADLLAIIALGIDAAALYGAGSGAVPRGIANTSGIGSVIGGTNGAAITIDNLIDMETAALSANVDETNLAYLANAKTVGALKKLKSSTGQYLWTNNPGGQRSATPGEINGYQVARSNQVRSNLTKGTASGICSELFFGDFSQVVMGEWGVLEILPNALAEPYYSQGAVQLRALQSLDIGLRHPQAFTVMSDALTS
ncbi:MAG: phage major capsid protein [Formivibrio sp.]|nr:phage major capsid protein [Formivibrio sp.]